MRLQGLPEWFDFLDQTPAKTFKQLGNGVNIAAVYNVMKSLVIRDLDLLGKDSDLVRTILRADNSPDSYLNTYHGPVDSPWSKETLQEITKLEILRTKKKKV